MRGERSDVGQCLPGVGPAVVARECEEGCVEAWGLAPQPSPSFGGEEHLFCSSCPLPPVQGAAGRGTISWRCFLFGEGVRAALPPAGLGEA